MRTINGKPIKHVAMELSAVFSAAIGGATLAWITNVSTTDAAMVLLTLGNAGLITSVMLVRAIGEIN